MARLLLWILGSPRSGTTFLTEYIGQFVDAEFNEPWKTHPLESPRLWKFPPKAKTIVFKYCENWRNIHVLMNQHPNSQYIHVWRDPDNVVYSMAFPKEGSYPPRNLYSGYDGDEKVKVCMQRWYSNMMHCLSLYNILPETQYTEIRYEKMRPGLKKLSDIHKLQFSLPQLNYKNKNLNDIELNWDLNPAAKELRNLVKKYMSTEPNGMLAEFVNKKRPKFLQRVVL